MATTFVGIECGGNRVRARHAAVVLQRRKRGGVEIAEWSCRIYTDEELLGYLAAEAGNSGVIAVHGRDGYATSELLRRIYRVLDYRLLFALAPKHRTRALVRVDPAEVQRLGGGVDAAPAAVLEAMRHLQPAVDFRPLTQFLDGLPATGKMRAQSTAAMRAAMAAYAALWCWWHGPAGYDVLGVNTEDYRLAPRMMDYEPDTGGASF